MNEKKICIIGAGGFGRETLTCLIDSLSESNLKIEEICVFMVEDEYDGNLEIMGIPVIKDQDFDSKKYKVVVAIGDPKKRKEIVSKLPPETEYAKIIHPSAVMSKWVEIGDGCIVTAGTIITCNVKIGKHAQLNLHTTIGHDCVIGDYFTSAPATNISGKCEFGECVYFGTNSSIREGIKICDDVTIGMGGIVVKNIDQAGVYIGSPVRKLQK